jgi:hypothetical protein
MKLNQLPQEIPFIYAAGDTCQLTSGPGFGKSETIRIDCIAALSEHYGEPFGIVEEHLATRDAPDIGGFMVPSKNADGQMVSAYTLPYIMTRVQQQVDKGFKRGLLFLDEFMQADHLVQKACAPLLLDGQIGEWSLPEGWIPIMASNRLADGAGANKTLTHIINRITDIPIEFDLDALTRWGERPQNNIHPMIMAFWKARTGVIYSDKTPKDGKPFSSPRSQVSAAKYLRLKLSSPDSMHIPDDEVTQQVIAGKVGAGCAAEMFAFFRVANELPTIEEIKADPMQAKRPDDTRLDAQYAAMTMAVYHADSKSVNQCFQYITRLNREMQTSAAKSLLEKQGGALLNSPELSTWIAKNKSLIMATTAGS